MTLIAGVITWYAASIGAPLYCGDTYSTAHDWLALPVEMYETGQAQCGDVFAVFTGAGLRYLPALDAGPFSGLCVEDGDACHPIVADLPRHVYDAGGRSAAGYVVNTMAAREEVPR